MAVGLVLNGGVILYGSWRQATVAASTTEAEYIAASTATKHALWARALLADMGITPKTVPLATDNQGALSLLKNPVGMRRAKHIDVVYHFARDRVMRREVAFVYMPTARMAADFMTKAVPAAKHRFCCDALGVRL